LSHIRELSDGRILAADPMSQVLLRLDFASGTADTIGRQGAGPQEYDGPDLVLSLPGDSTLLVDLRNGRLIVVDPEGVFVEWTPMTTTHDSGDTRTIHPNFTDNEGNIYAMAPHFLENAPDSFTINKIDRATGEETSVAKRWRTEYARRPRDAKRPMFVPSDDWAVGSDGRVAVIRANGYSVDWFLPDGSVVKGPQHDAQTFPVGTAEMEEEFGKISSKGIFTRSVVSDAGMQSMQMSRGIPPGFFRGFDDFEWPETLPVFRQEGALVSPSGEAWVERMMPAGEQGRVDVFDEQGVRKGFVGLPPRSRIIAFGADTDSGELAYLTRIDDMGLVWLERYRITRTDDRR
jgi:hypothetical protein